MESQVNHNFNYPLNKYPADTLIDRKLLLVLLSQQSQYFNENYKSISEIAGISSLILDYAKPHVRVAEYKIISNVYIEENNIKNEVKRLPYQEDYHLIKIYRDNKEWKQQWFLHGKNIDLTVLLLNMKVVNFGIFMVKDIELMTQQLNILVEKRGGTCMENCTELMALLSNIVILTIQNIGINTENFTRLIVLLIN